MFNLKFIGVLKHPGYNGLDPVSLTAETILPEILGTAAGGMATAGLDTAVIPSLLTGTGGIASGVGAGEALGGAAAITSGLPEVGGSVLSGIGGLTPDAAASFMADPALASTATETATELAPETFDAAAQANQFVSPYTNAGTDLSNMSTDNALNDTVQSNQIASHPVLGPTTTGPEIPTSIPQPNYTPSPVDTTTATDAAKGGYDAGNNSVWSSIKDAAKGIEAFHKEYPLLTNLGIAGGVSLLSALNTPTPYQYKKYSGPLSKYHLASNYQPVTPTPNVYTPSYAAQGGVMKSFAPGGIATASQNQMYPQSQQVDKTQFVSPNQMPAGASQSLNFEPQVNPTTGEMVPRMAPGGIVSFDDGGNTDTKITNEPDQESPILKWYNKKLAETRRDKIGAGPGDTTVKETDPEYRLADPNYTTLGRMNKLNTMYGIDTPLALKPQKPLYAVNLKPAMIQQAQQAQQAQQMPVTELAAKGGIMGYAAGGPTEPTQPTHQYQPYQGYQGYQNPNQYGGNNPQINWQDNTNKGLGFQPTGFLGEVFNHPDAHGGYNPKNNQSTSSVSGLADNYQATAPVVANPYQSSYESYAGNPGADINTDSYGNPVYASGGVAGYSLGGYAAGGNPRLLKGPGDGMSDNIPATIADKQPARLADGEFVVPADVVSHLGNGSTDAGAKKLYAMMDKVRVARTGKKAQGKQINPNKFLPA